MKFEDTDSDSCYLALDWYGNGRGKNLFLPWRIFTYSMEARWH